ncbi:MAG: hypothetical protein EON54_19315 [Alcaligenaceae bacterium]|nr:MAG: hypothetical protein EON54_19315 [Alcaligenaceae bacterium]
MRDIETVNFADLSTGCRLRIEALDRDAWTREWQLLAQSGHSQGLCSVGEPQDFCSNADIGNVDHPAVERCRAVSIAICGFHRLNNLPR